MAKQSSSAPSAPSAESIREQCHGKVWERGRALARGGALTELARAGEQLFGRCAGSYQGAYQLQARLENGAVAHAACSCPFEGGGWCKHLVALLLRYADAPDEFRVTPSLSEMLDKLKRDELVSLVETLVKDEPQLMKTLVQIYKNHRAADANSPAEWRANLRDALAGRGASEGRVTLDLAVKTATQLENKKDWAGASAMWRTVLEELVFAVPHFEDIEQEEPEYDSWGGYHDEEVDTGEAWAESAVAGLERCLDRETLAPEPREEILKTLWQCWRDSSHTETFILPEAAFDRVLAEANAALWAEIEDYALNQLGRKSRFPDAVISDAWVAVELSPHLDYPREHTLEWLTQGLTLRGEAARAQALLRQFGSYRQQLALLMQDRDWEAIEKLALRNESSHQPSLLVVADDLENAGQHERAERLALRAQEVGYARAVVEATDWLTRFYLRHKRVQPAQTWAAALFVARPDAPSLQLWKAAIAQGDDWDDWDNRYPRLEKSPDFTPLLRARLAMLDGRVARALELFGSLDKREKSGLEAELARACEAGYPAEASALYRQMGEAQIAQRQYSDARAAYRRAAGFWQQARDVHKKAGTMDDWITYIRAQRETHKRLPALMDELKKAGL